MVQYQTPELLLQTTGMVQLLMNFDLDVSESVNLVSKYFVQNSVISCHTFHTILDDQIFFRWIYFWGPRGNPCFFPLMTFQFGRIKIHWSGEGSYWL